MKGIQIVNAFLEHRYNWLLETLIVAQPLPEEAVFYLFKVLPAPAHLFFHPCGKTRASCTGKKRSAIREKATDQ